MVRSRFREYEEETFRSPACCKQENTTSYSRNPERTIKSTPVHTGPSARSFDPPFQTVKHLTNLSELTRTDTSDRWRRGDKFVAPSFVRPRPLVLLPLYHSHVTFAQRERVLQADVARDGSCIGIIRAK